MASITIRNLDDSIKTALRVRAAQAGRSMEEQARKLLTEALSRIDEPDHRDKRKKLDRAERIAAIMANAGGGVDLPPYPDRPVDFDGIDHLAKQAFAHDHK